MDYSVLTWGSSDAGGYSGAERAQLFEGVRECPRAYKPYKDYKALQAFIRLYKPYKALIKGIKKYLKIFEYWCCWDTGAAVHLGLLVSACEPFKLYFIKEDLAAGLACDYA